MAQEKGNLSIHSENILPIIKKWLYSDTDIFIRELVSNATDAITKLKRLDSLGEVDLPDDEPYAVKVVLDKAASTIKVIDNGLGMTADEVKQYINQIAFSGANDFVSKYQEKMDAGSEIIGHFGLGFYSAFMVADKVQIDTLSYREGAVAARWISDGGIEFEMDDSDRTERGTTITLYVGESGQDFLEDYKLRTILRKYCSFVPVDLFFENAAEEKKPPVEINEDNEEITVNEPKPINERNPLWNKKAGDCTDEEYKDFFRKTFNDYNEPLFWIHLNMDYPFRLKGILYFPKLKHELESIEGQVKLYSNQIYIADNIKEVIPEFLLLLKGVLDCPDLPLNVSRSFLQNDGYVTKMSGYITKKVADKLTGLFENEREQYDKYWDDIAPFIKYGCIREKDFYDKVKNAVLYKTSDSKYLTLDEYLAANEPKIGKKVLYASNLQQQAQYVRLLADQGVDAAVLDTRLDAPFISYIESYEGGGEGEEKVTFARIDSDLSDVLKNEAGTDEAESTALSALFQKVLANEELAVKVENLKTSEVPAIILLSEQSRRMQEMSKMFGGMGAMPSDMFKSDETLVLNRTNRLVARLLTLADDDTRADDASLICAQLYDLAMMSHRPLDSDAMNAFVSRSAKILEKLAK